MNLQILNPWWKGKEFINEDKNLKELKDKKYIWEPTLLKKIDLIPNNVYTLRGPRQIGKTTLIKLLIKFLLEKNIDEKSIFFWSCEELVDFKELIETLREYLIFSKNYNIKEKYVFLDEVSKIKDWQRAIKSLIDSGELSNTCIFLTGSHSLDIKYKAELLPGRRGRYGKDFLLLPLTFREYIKLLKPRIHEKLKTVKDISIDNLNSAISIANLFKDELHILFNQYLITGGFPLVINEFFDSGNIPEYVYEIYRKWVVGDIVKWGKSEKILLQLLRGAIQKQSTTISWDSLAKEVEIKSHKTVSSYVEALENMFVLMILYYLDLNKKIPNYNKNKKIYFLDPFIFHAFNNAIFFKSNEISPSLIESTVVSHLHRKFQVFYWKNKTEVDAVIKTGERVFGVEIKYQNKISKSDMRGLYRFKDGIMITKDVLEIKEKRPCYPVYLFLAVI